MDRMHIEEENFIYGEMITHNNFCTKEQVQEALDLQKEKGSEDNIADLLVELGHMTAAQRDMVHTILGKDLSKANVVREGTDEEKAFSKLVAMKQAAGTGKVDEAMKLSKEEDLGRLGELFVLKAAMLKENELGKDVTIFECPKCKTTYSVTGNVGDRKFKCKKCGIHVEKRDIGKFLEKGVDVEEE